MRFVKLSWKNLFSYGDYYSEVQLDQDGIVFVRGVNKENNTSNGSGKSSIIDVFVWALYGKPLKNVPADHVKNTHTRKTGHACLGFWIGDDYYELNRYRGDKEFGNGVMIKRNNVIDENIANGTNRDVQKRLDALLGLDYHAMTSSIIFSSETPFLIPKLTPDKRREHLESILGLKSYSEYGKIAKGRVRTARRELDDMVIETREKKNFVLQEKDSLDEYTKLHENFSVVKEQQITNIEASIGKLTGEIQELKTEVKLGGKAEERIAEVKTELRKGKAELSEIDVLVATAKAHKQSTDKEIASVESQHKSKLLSLQKEYNGSKRRITAAIQLMQQECPTCSRGWESEEVDHHTTIHNQELNSLEAEYALSIETEQIVYNGDLETANANKNAFTTELADLSERKTSISNELSTKISYLNELEGQYNKLPKQSDIDAALVSLDRLIADLDNKADEVNPYKDVIDSIVVKIEDYEDQLEKVNDNKEMVEERLKYATFWDESFNSDGLKLFVFESVIPILNSRIAYYLPLMFQEREIRLSFDKMMNMVIITNEAGMSYGNLSMGERKRVDIAIALALLDTAQAQYGLISNCMFFDEIFDSSLDSQGVQTVSEILHSMPVETIFVMSHRLEIANGFDNVLDVEKRGKYSRILT